MEEKTKENRSRNHTLGSCIYLCVRASVCACAVCLYVRACVDQLPGNYYNNYVKYIVNYHIRYVLSNISYFQSYIRI